MSTNAEAAFSALIIAHRNDFDGDIFTPVGFANIGRLGFSLVIVLFDDITPGHRVLWRNGVGPNLERDLFVANAGEFHSTGYLATQRQVFHCFFATNVPEAIAALNKGLKRLGFLEFGKILVAGTLPDLLILWPGLAQALKATT